jgi:hypothetical protein
MKLHGAIYHSDEEIIDDQGVPVQARVFSAMSISGGNLMHPTIVLKRMDGWMHHVDANKIQALIEQDIIRLATDDEIALFLLGE